MFSMFITEATKSCHRVREGRGGQYLSSLGYDYGEYIDQ